MRNLFPLLLTLGLVAAALPATSDAGAATFYHEAGGTTTGVYGVSLTFDFGEDNRCELRTVSSGLLAPSPIYFWEEWSTWGAGAFYSTYTAQGHSVTPIEGVSVDTREVRARGSGFWSLESIYSGVTFSGTVTWTHVNLAATAWQAASGKEYPPFVLDVACEKPFTTSAFMRGDEGVAFTPDDMKGEYGASFTQLFGSVTVLQDGATSGAFAGDEVRLRVKTSVWEGQTSGELRVSGPDGAQAWTLTGADAISATYGPGSYDIALDYFSFGLDETLLGVMYALTPVASLDG